jgi:hypothetical protein
MKGSYKVGQREIIMKKQYNTTNLKKRFIIAVVVTIITTILRKREAKKALEAEGWVYDKEDKKYHKEVGFSGIFDDDIMKDKLNRIGLKWNIIAFLSEITLGSIFKCNKVFK